MSSIAIAPMLVVLFAAAITLGLRSWPRVQQAASVTSAVAYVLAVGVLIWRVVFAPDASAIAYQVGGWQAPFGITLVADPLSAFMLAITAVVVIYANLLSILYVSEENQQIYYHPLFFFLVLGTTGAFLTGDLFNLFVWFEVILMTSYVFVAFYGNAQHTAAAMRYVVLNTIGGVLLLLAIGGLYATLGTLNMADMALQLRSMDPGQTRPVVGFTALLLASFGLKAGLVPFQFWVPGAYRSAPLPVVAIFAGATKKVGMYAIIRIYFTVLGGATLPTDVPLVGVTGPLAFLGPVLLGMGLLSIIFGGLSAVSQNDLEAVFAYSSIGQVGFIAVPVAIAASTASPSLRHLGIFAGLVFAMHHAFTKMLLFLSTAAIRDAAGTTKIGKLGGFAERSPLFAVVFLVGGLSLVGIPPLAGFFGKLFVFDAAASGFASVSSSSRIAVTAGTIVVLLVGAVLSIIYSTRAWLGCFWGAQSRAVETASLHHLQIGVLATLALVIILVGTGFEPVYQFADAAADAATDTEGYIETVLGGGGE
jgi:multicomponent Na+:H+ antiporter subunit D